MVETSELPLVVWMVVLWVALKVALMVASMVAAKVALLVAMLADPSVAVKADLSADYLVVKMVGKREPS